MRAWLAILLITPALLGCIGSDDAPLNQTNVVDDTPETPEHVSRYTAGGDPVNETTRLVEPVGETVYNLTGYEGAEPTMGITDSGAIFATADDHMIRSTDDGQTWEVVYTVGLEGDEGQPTNLYGSWDPLMYVDHVTDTVYMDPMFPPLLCTELSWSTDDGETWTTNPAACHPPPMDHQKFFTALPGPEAPPQAGVAHETVLYQCYNALSSTNCAVSYDGGVTWPNVQPVADTFTGNCGGINGFGAGSPSGVAAVPLQSGCEKATIAVTMDSGLTWTLRKVPNATGVEAFDPEVQFDGEGNLYLIWRGSDQHTYLARSSDDGESWDGPWDITPPEVESTIFNSISVTDGGQLGIAFLGTPDTGEGPNEAPEDARWNLYQLTSRDGTAPTPTFTSYQVTPDEDPVHVGRICTGGIGCGEKRNLLEFIDTAISPDGTLYTIYTEGCVDACAEDPTGEESTAQQVAWARLDGIDLTSPPTLVPANGTSNATADANGSSNETAQGNESGNETGNESANGTTPLEGWVVPER